MKNVVFIIILITLTGCTYHWETAEPLHPTSYKTKTYRSESSIGKLRKLVLMPVYYETYNDRYSTVKEYQEKSRQIEALCLKYLQEKKGYEIVMLSDNTGQWNQSLFDQNTSAVAKKLYKEWTSEKYDFHSAKLIKQIGTLLDVDGILVIRLNEEKTWDTLDGVMNIALMNIPLFYRLSKPVNGAWIYETTSGNLVWSEESASINDNVSADINTLLQLFRDLENAVPKQIIQR